MIEDGILITEAERDAWILDQLRAVSDSWADWVDNMADRWQALEDGFTESAPRSGQCGAWME